MTESYNSRIPNYSNEPDDEFEEISLQSDFLLFSERFKGFIKKVDEEISLKGPVVANVARAILNKSFLQDVNRHLGDRLSDLMDKSDELIESTNSNSLEIKEMRKMVADEMSEVLKMQDEIRPLLGNIDRSNALIYSSDPKVVKEAEELIEKIKSGFDFLIRPNQGLN